MPQSDSADTEPRIRNTQYALCLSTSRTPDADLDRELETASRAGFSCVELWAPALDVYLARRPLVWLDIQLRQHSLHVSAVSGLDPLPAPGIAHREDVLIHQARFLELCTNLDALGGGTLVLHLGANKHTYGVEASARALRHYADLAAPFEVTLALEFSAQSDIPDLRAALDLVQRAAQSNLRLAIGAREWCAAGGDPRLLDALEPGLLALVRLDAAPEPAARDLYAHLAAAGFRGPYSLPLPAPSPAGEAPATPDTPQIPNAQDTPWERARAARQAALDLLAPPYDAPPAP